MGSIICLVAPINRLNVVFAIILALAFLGEAVTISLAHGGALVVAGVVVIAWPIGS